MFSIHVEMFNIFQENRGKRDAAHEMEDQL